MSMWGNVLRDTLRWFKQEPWFAIPLVLCVWRLTTTREERAAHLARVLERSDMEEGKT